MIASEYRNDSFAVEVETSTLLQSKHGFSTRLGGVSEGIWESLNLGMNRGDEPQRVEENWRRFLGKCQIPEDGIVWGKQVHGNYVHIATKQDISRLEQPECLREADGYVTKEAGVPLVVFSADCVPLLLEDSLHGVVGAVHSGWRSTVLDIESQAIQKMKLLGAREQTICVAIGPAIGGCCFEVGKEVIEGVEALLGDSARAFYQRKQDKYMLDLKGVIKKRLLQLGILETHIQMLGGCTMCNPTRYWSHRYTSGERGSLASVIMR